MPQSKLRTGPNQNSPDLIIWDLDGTLIDSLRPTFEAMNDAIEPFLKRRLSVQELFQYFGPPENIILERIVGQENALVSFQLYLKAAKNRVNDIALFDGIAEVLSALISKKYTLAIFTGRGRATTNTLLEKLALTQLFSIVVTADDIQNSKPNPEGIHKICKILGRSSKSAIMIGDSHLDILAARAAGAIAIGHLWDLTTNRQALESAQAHHILNHPKELLEILESLVEV